jgi:hypothetical protein
MNAEQIEKQAKELLLDLRGYVQRDAIAVLSTAICSTVTKFDQGQLDKQAAVPSCSLLIRRRGKLSRIDQNVELKDFIHGLDRYVSLFELHGLLIERFGKDRTPSKSSIHRYLQKLQQNNEGKI